MTYKFHTIKVLVVDDNRPMTELMKGILMTFGITNVVFATDGVSGFDKFCKENPDLVITDWMMRPHDGITFSKRIRNDRASPNQYVPIILMTGFSEKSRVLDARDSGVTEFLVKPFNARDLYRRISEIIENPRQFVRAESFFGPDRRRKTANQYTGLKRRKSDRNENISPAELDKVLKT